MKAPIVYLAEPIDYRDSDLGVIETVHRVNLALHGSGCSLYTPLGAWWAEGDPRPEIQQVNMAALDRADGLLAVLPDDVRSVGVPMEIERANALGIPVAIVGGETIQRSWVLRGRGALFGDGVVSIRAAVEWLKEKMDERADWLVSERRVGVAGPGPIPTKTYPDDVGWDLYYDAPMESGRIIWPGGAMDVPCGVRIEWPEGMWALVVGRSSTFKKGLLCSVGVIDPGYRGEYFAVLHNISDKQVEIMPGDRVAQAIPFPNAGLGLAMERVDALSETDRGEQGFGSSGR